MRSLAWDRTAFVHGLVSLLLFALAVSVSWGQDNQQPSGGDDQAHDEASTAQRMRFKLWKECIENSDLHGAWLVKWRPYTTDDGGSIGYKVAVIIDAQKEKQQLEIIRQKLAESQLTPPPEIDRVYKLPLAELLIKVSRLVREQTSNPGCLVSGAVYGPDPSSTVGTDPDSILEVVPYGRTQSATEREAVVAAFRSVLSTKGPWQEFGKESGLELVVVDKRLRTVAPSSTMYEDWDKVRNRLRREQVTANAWVELAECQDYAGKFMHYDLFVRFDAAESQISASQLEKVLDGAVERHLRIVECDTVPISELLRRINLAIEASPQLNGCHVGGAEFVLRNIGGEAKYCLVLSGQLAEERQRELLSVVVGKLMKKQPDWDRYLGRSDFVTLFDQLSLSATSSAVGRQLYGQALSEYRRRDYAAAVELFGDAAVAAPSKLQYRYWRVVALLQMSSETEAFDHMRSIVNRQESRQARLEVMRSLERVQGKLRQRLRTLEAEAQMLAPR